MRSVNKVILVGNLTKDPQIKATGSGHSFTAFTLATNREWFSPDGKKESLAEFHKVVAWGKLADLCGSFLKKGKLIYVEGYLKTRAWDDEEGIKRFRTEVVAQDMIMLNKKGEVGDEDFAPVEDYSGENFDSEPSAGVDLDGDHI